MDRNAVFKENDLKENYNIYLDLIEIWEMQWSITAEKKEVKEK